LAIDDSSPSLQISSPKMRSSSRLIVLALAALLTACAPHSGTEAQRMASFKRYESAKIGDQSAWDYLLTRTAWVTAGKNLEARLAPGTKGTHFNVRLRMNSKSLRFGSATAIDRRGYFLTAAHNLDGPVCYVAFYKRGIRLLPADVVWRGNENRGEPDVAIIRVPETLAWVFPWASIPGRGTGTLSAGLDIGPKLHFQISGIGGSLTRAAQRHRRGSIPWTIVMHDTPLHHGDSGGPLITQEGGLLGINTEAYAVDVFSLPKIRQSSAAHRPDPNLIRRLIEEDVASRRAHKSPGARH
jgi:S1-C subfamily serine protease